MQEVSSGIYVTIMTRAALALPLPYSKLCDTFGAAKCAALGTELGRPCLGHFHVTGAVPAGLISEHSAEGRPRCVQRGFVRADVDIADNDKTVLLDESNRRDVKIMLATRPDFRVQRTHSLSAPGALGDRDLLLKPRVVARISDGRSIRTRGKVLEAQVKPDHAVAAGAEIFGHFARQADVPTPARILNETARLEPTLDGSVVPQAIAALLENDDVALKPDRAVRSHERHPAESPAWTGRCAPPGTTMVCIASPRKISRNGLKHIGPDWQSCPRRASEQLVQVERRGPPATPSLGAALCLGTEIPDKIDRPREFCEHARVLDSVAVGEHHGKRTLCSTVAHAVSHPLPTTTIWAADHEPPAF
jgi:hypothetical protein